MALMAYRAAVHNGAAGLLLFIDAPGCSRQPEQTSVKKGWPWAARPGRSRKKNGSVLVVWIRCAVTHSS